MAQRRFHFKRLWLFLLIILCIGLWHKSLLRIYFVFDYKDRIISCSASNGISPALICAVVFTESRFDPLAKSHKGALGLMQIMPQTGNWVAQQISAAPLNTAALLDPNNNLSVGIWYMAYLKRYFSNNENLALASYNAGARYVKEWVRQGVWAGDAVKADQIPFPETRKYVLRIIMLKRIYGYLYPELSYSVTILPGNQ